MDKLGERCDLFRPSLSMTFINVNAALPHKIKIVASANRGESMMSIRTGIDKVLSELREEKDALKVRMHLAKLEALEGWDKVEEVFEDLKEEKDVARVKMHLVKLEALEGLDKLTEKLGDVTPEKEDIRVRMHLAKLGLLEEWDELEDKMHHMKEKAVDLGDEVKAGIQRLKSRLQ